MKSYYDLNSRMIAEFRYTWFQLILKKFVSNRSHDFL